MGLLIEMYERRNPAGTAFGATEIHRLNFVAAYVEIASTGDSKRWGNVIERVARAEPEQPLSLQQQADHQRNILAFQRVFGDSLENEKRLVNLWWYRKPMREGLISLELISRTQSARHIRRIEETLKS
jgi:hypothetical protein